MTVQLVTSLESFLNHGLLSPSSPCAVKESSSLIGQSSVLQQDFIVQSFLIDKLQLRVFKALIMWCSRSTWFPWQHTLPVLTLFGTGDEMYRTGSGCRTRPDEDRYSLPSDVFISPTTSNELFRCVHRSRNTQRRRRVEGWLGMQYFRGPRGGAL